MIPRSSFSLQFPYLAVLITGRHTQIVAVKSPVDFVIIANSLDEAIGETIDKLCNACDIVHPKFLPKALRIPIKTDLDIEALSLSGIKYKYIRDIQCIPREFFQEKVDLVHQCMFDISAILSRHVKIAFEACIKSGLNINEIVFSGGVIMNSFFVYFLKEQLGPFLIKKSCFCRENLCSDNAEMIAWAAKEILESRKNFVSNYWDSFPRPTWSLDYLDG